MRDRPTLNEKTIKTLVLPAKGMRIEADGKLPRFGLRLTSAGAKTFVFCYRNRGGLNRTYTIGPYPTWSAAAARDEAKRIAMLVDQGEDPHAEKNAERVAPDMKRLAERYLAEHAIKKRTGAEDKKMLRKWILPALGSRKVHQIRGTDIAALHAKVTRAGSPIRANRVVALLSKMFSLSVRWEYRDDNPCRGAVERNPETKRDRFLTAEEIARLSEALAAHNSEEAANAIRLLTLTGARRMEVLAAPWSQFDLDQDTWTKPALNTKQKKLHHVPCRRQCLIC